jgi:hypothetical protein
VRELVPRCPRVTSGDMLYRPDSGHCPSRLHLPLMLALAFSTGIIVDAVGYLDLDQVFTGNMTGSVAVPGMAPAGGDDLPIAGPPLALAGCTGGVNR